MIIPKIKTQFYILILTIILINSCKKNEEEINNNGNNQPREIQLNSYPLTVGNTWKYYTESHIADSAGTIHLSHYYDNFWEVISDTTIIGVACTKISQRDSMYGGPNHLAYTFYANKPDGFYGMAVENSGTLFFLRTTELFKRTQFNLIGSFGDKFLANDTVFVPSPSLRCRL